MDIDELVAEVVSINKLANTSKIRDSIELLINRVITDIELECNRDFTEEAIPRGLESLVIDMTGFRLNVRGNEHLASENIAEISRTYNTDYPEYIKQRLKRLRRVRVW